MFLLSTINYENNNKVFLFINGSTWKWISTCIKCYSLCINISLYVTL